MLSVLAPNSASAQGALTGDVPSGRTAGGVALVEWGGGTMESLQVAAAQQGCTLSSVWLTVKGKFVGYTVGAPAFANASWLSRVGEDLSPQPLLIVCKTPGLGFCEASSQVFDRTPGAPGTETPRDALDQGIKTLSALPRGTFVEANTTTSQVVWNLVSDDGVVVGEFTIGLTTGGYSMEHAEFCVFE